MSTGDANSNEQVSGHFQSLVTNAGDAAKIQLRHFSEDLRANLKQKITADLRDISIPGESLDTLRFEYKNGKSAVAGTDNDTDDKWFATAPQIKISLTTSNVAYQTGEINEGTSFESYFRHTHHSPGAKYCRMVYESTDNTPDNATCPHNITLSFTISAPTVEDIADAFRLNVKYTDYPTSRLLSSLLSSQQR